MKEFIFNSVEEDQDQAIGKTKVCIRFECQGWDGHSDKPIRPKLYVNYEGFLTCPKCGYNY